MNKIYDLYSAVGRYRLENLEILVGTTRLRLSIIIIIITIVQKYNYSPILFNYLIQNRHTYLLTIIYKII